MATGRTAHHSDQLRSNDLISLAVIKASLLEEYVTDELREASKSSMDALCDLLIREAFADADSQAIYNSQFF